MRLAIRLDPANIWAHREFARVLQYLDDGDRLAEAEMREALRLNPNDPFTHFLLAQLLTNQARWSDAEAEFKEALRLNPDHTPARNGLDRLQHPTAEEAKLRGAVLAIPRDATAHNNLADFYCRTGNLPAAAFQCREALRLRPDSGVAHCTMGE